MAKLTYKMAVNNFATFILYTGVFAMTFSFGYLMHALSIEVHHDNQFTALRDTIALQDAKLAKCTPAIGGSVTAPLATPPLR